MKAVIKSVVLGICCSIVTHLIAFGCFAVTAFVLSADSREILVSNFVLVSMEGLGSAVAALCILFLLNVLPVKKMSALVMAFTLLLTLVLPGMDVLICGEYILMFLVFAHLVLFIAMWYLFFNLRNRECSEKCCCETLQST